MGGVAASEHGGSLPPSTPFQILALDGGGLRGLFGAAVLAELEADLAVILADSFDLIVGTSTGGLIALALGAGLSPKDVVDFYVDRGPGIFRAGRGKLRNARRAKHSPAPLREALIDVFGDRTLGSSTKRLVVPAYSLDAQDVYIFKTPHNTDLTRDWRERMVDVALATSAAPTFLPAHRLRHLRLIDGGVWANNPTLVGVVEAVSMLGVPLDAIRVLSMGTTDEVGRVGSEVDDGGWLDWATVAPGVVLRAQSLGTFHAAEHLIGKDAIERVSASVPEGLFGLDRVDAGAIRGLAEDVSRRVCPNVKGFTEHVAAPYVPCYGPDVTGSASSVAGGVAADHEEGS